MTFEVKTGATADLEVGDKIPMREASSGLPKVFVSPVTQSELAVLSGSTKNIATEINKISQFNAIINGDFNVWQRGSSFAAITNGTYCADRWKTSKAVTSAVYTISKSSDVPTVAQAGRKFASSLKLEVTTADASVAAGDLAYLRQDIEGYVAQAVGERAMTLSFWVKAFKAGIYCATIICGGSSYVVEYTINASNTWEFKTINFLASPTPSSYESSTGMTVGFTQMSGATYQTTAGAWNSGTFLGTANQVNNMDSTSNTFFITGVKLEAGSIVTPFSGLTYSEELVICQRYYEVLGAGAVGRWYASTACALGIKFSATKRASPTMSVVNTTPNVAEIGVAQRTGSGSALASSSATISGANFDLNGFTGATSGNTAILQTDAIAAASEL